MEFKLSSDQQLFTKIALEWAIAKLAAALDVEPPERRPGEPENVNLTYARFKDLLELVLDRRGLMFSDEEGGFVPKPPDWRWILHLHTDSGRVSWECPQCGHLSGMGPKPGLHPYKPDLVCPGECPRPLVNRPL